VYRRLNALSEHDLLREERQIDAGGNHYTAFETTLDRVEFRIEDGEYAVDIQLRGGLVDGSETFWSDLDRSRSGLDLNDGPDRAGTTGDTNHG